MLKYGLSAALLLAAAPALAQGGHTPPPAIQAAAQAFGQCIGAGLQGLAATVTPEAGAATVLSGCATQRQELERVADGFIASLPEAERAAARDQMRAQLGQIQPQITEAIRRRRAGGGAAPTN